MISDVLAVILGGGQGTRLYPLTQHRSKPAVPLAGKFRLIDIPISNCINSGIGKIFILTQFNSASLNRHITRTYKFDHFSSGFVEILAAEQTMDNPDWYQGTADAVRQNLRHYNEVRADYILILSGDQLYRMDFREMLATHRQMKADFTVAATPVAKERAKDLGILKTDRQGVIISFREKPKTDSDLAPLKADEKLLAERGAKPNRPYLASMGIYLFKREVLTKILQDSDATDFGKHIIPRSIISYRAAAHLFSGYWEDIGSIKNFFDANLDLTTDHPKFDFYDAKAQIFTRARFLPGTRVNGCQIQDSIISEGGILTKCKIKHSIVGIRSIVRENCSIAESILMGADWYETPDEQRLAKRKKLPPIGIGPGCIFERVIVDKNARIGSNVVIRDSGARKDSEGEWYAVSDGIVVIKRGAIVPDGSRL